MIKLYDVVRLIVDDNENGISKGSVGTVIDILDNGAAYTIEFQTSDSESDVDAPICDYREDALSVVIPSDDIQLSSV